MGKKHAIVLSSSEDEDKDCFKRGNCRSSTSKLRKNTDRKRTRMIKESSKLDSQFLEELSRKEEVNFDLLADEFSGLHGIIHGSRWRDSQELWVDKHKPRSIEELAVQKKKVEEVKMWLDQMVVMSKERFLNNVLIISGQAGTGKSTTVHVIASTVGADVFEWKTPTPTLWQEHKHNSSSGIPYTSKLEEFENFVERVRKYPLLSAVSTGNSRKPAILLIDDLPITNGGVAYGRLKKCLQLLVHSSQVPTIILLTDYGKTDTSDTNSRLVELQSVLEGAGASKVAFNPLTVNSIKKTLSRLCREEKCTVTADFIDHIAKTSGGDIRNAITTLQFFCLRPDPTQSFPLSAAYLNHVGGKSDDIEVLSSPLMFGKEDFNKILSLPAGKDETLTLFHALGKFLHNKRETTKVMALGVVVHLKERLARYPLKMDAPENILSQAHGQASQVADFLHENVLDFMSDEAIDDAWTVCSYLSDSDQLLATAQQSIWSQGTLVQSIAASVAARGVLFGNSRPLTSRWHTIRSPKLWQVEQSSRRNKDQMVLERFESVRNFGSSTMSVMATEFRPIHKWLKFRTTQDLQVNNRARWEYSDWTGPDELDTDDNLGESDDDDIEEW
ncbi:cell cycle checkpoint protein RAD17 isoform X2 [Aristolochia californica]|uniref:cell cycle checkpoint protein RAD17 isoform X2 n=1 Tax=Aristolochia californica TaxID=171875 RepID=UPI0035D913ED